MKILVLDDDRELVDLLGFTLLRAGLTPLRAYDAASGLAAVERDRPDLAVVDIELGADSGLAVLRAIRARSGMPVIILTVRNTEEDTLEAFALGATDYLTKPFSYRELIARIRVHAGTLSHAQETPPLSSPHAELRAGPLVLDTAGRLTRSGETIHLAESERRLLRYLMLHQETVVPTRVLLRDVWGKTDGRANNDVVRTTLYRLRRKLGDDGPGPGLLHTIPGVGVMLKAVAPPAALTTHD